MVDFNSIGEVKSRYKEPVGPDEMKEHESTIIVSPEFSEGLNGVEDNDYLQILFYLDKMEGYDLKGKRRHGRVRGVFASRSPRRPNSIGLTTVKLLERNDNELKVYGLDAVDGTPVLDIKPYAAPMDEIDHIKKHDLKENPRKEINQLIKKRNLEKLLFKSGELHGHFCPYLSLGVKAGSYAIRELQTNSKGMEDLLAIVETNSCFSDGIQYSTGCTFGNNALIYKDYGKTAVTITKRNGKGIRLKLKEEKVQEKREQETQKLFEKVIEKREGTKEEEEKTLNKRWSQEAFDLIKVPIEQIFEIKEVEINSPDYAPIYEDKTCEECGEQIMAPKSVKQNGKILCIPCAEEEYYQLDGRGINKIEQNK